MTHSLYVFEMSKEMFTFVSSSDGVVEVGRKREDGWGCSDSQLSLWGVCKFWNVAIQIHYRQLVCKNNVGVSSVKFLYHLFILPV